MRIKPVPRIGVKKSLVGEGHANPATRPNLHARKQNGRP
jgi:hypothetical protein